MKNHFFYLFIISFYFLSCKKEKKQSFNNVVNIDISETFKEKQKINLSTVASKIEYIQLKSDTTCYLGQIYNPKRQIQFSKDKILISDAQNTLFLFDISGKFINKIGNVGKGPKEYVKPDNFTFLMNGKELLIAVFSAAQKKTLIYNCKGNFLKEIFIDFMPIGLGSIEEDLVFINTIGRRKQSGYYNLSIVSTKGYLKQRIFFKQNEKIIEEKGDLFLSTFFSNYKIKDEFSYWEKDYDTIWRISKDFKTTPKYFIDIGGSKIPFEEQIGKGREFFQKFQKHNVITNVNESTRFFLIDVHYKEKLNRIYYDKTTKESFCVEYKKEIGRGLNFSFYNNIDGGMPFWPINQVSDNKMYRLIYGYELKEYLDRKAIDIEILDKEARKKLLQLAKNSKTSDNPILMVVTLKE